MLMQQCQVCPGQPHGTLATERCSTNPSKAVVWPFSVDRGRYRGGGFRAGDNFVGSFVFKEGGETLPWRNLGASAVQCVREAV